MSDQPLRLAIVGCGTVAQTTYTRTLPRSRFVRTEFVSDLRSEAAQGVAAKLGARVATLGEIHRDADAVIIATPPSSHFELVSACLEHVPLVVCEKPFVGRRSEAEALAQMAKERGRTLYVAHFRRLFPSVQLARAVGALGGLGRVTALDIVEGGRFSWEAESGYVSSDPFGGVLYDTGSHTIDMALFAAGLDEMPLSVRIRDVQRDRAEPSHALSATFDLETSEMGCVPVSVRLSRYETLANVVRIRYERGELLFSAGLRGTVRLTGPAGSTLLQPAIERTDFGDCFVDQWNVMFGSRHADVFAVHRFVNLTGVLEALATAA